MKEINETEFHRSGFLFLIGIGVFVCLVILTIISLMDLKADKTSTQNMSPAAFRFAPQNMSICPFCGTKGTPQCFRCGATMQWNDAGSVYQCPGCNRFGNANCPSCGSRMQPYGSPWSSPPMRMGTPVAAGCATCPSANSCFGGTQQVAMPYQGGNQPYGGGGQPAVVPVNWGGNGTQQAVAPCPGACPTCPLGTPQSAAPVAWPYGNGYGRPNLLICPNCRCSISHPYGVPAYAVQCPFCGTAMVRG